MSDADENKKDVKPASATEPTPGMMIAGALVFGVLAGLLAPEAFLLVVFLGTLFHQKILKNTIATFVATIFMCGLSACFHLSNSPITYKELMAANPYYFMTGVILFLAGFVLTLAGRAWIAFLVAFLACLPGIFITYTDQPVPVIGFAIFIILVCVSKAVRPAHAVLVAFAALHCFLCSGLITVYGAAPVFPEKSEFQKISLDKLKKTDPETYKAVTFRDLVKDVIRADEKKYGPGEPEKIVVGEKSGDLYVLMARGNGASIIVLDPETLDIKRRSFDGIGGGFFPDFDVNEEDGLIAVTKGKELLIADTKLLEWRDSLIVDKGKVCFAGNHSLVLLMSAGGRALVVTYDSNGLITQQFLSVYAGAAGAGNLSCDKHTAYITSRYAGTIETPSNGELLYKYSPNESYPPLREPYTVGGYLNPDSVEIFKDRAWLKLTDKESDEIAYIDLERLKRPGEEKRPGPLRYLVMPLSFSRSTEKTP